MAFLRLRRAGGRNGNLKRKPALRLGDLNRADSEEPTQRRNRSARTKGRYPPGRGTDLVLSALRVLRISRSARRQTSERRVTCTTRPRCPVRFVSPGQRLRAFVFRGLILPEIKEASPPSCLPCPLSQPQAGGQSFGGLSPPEVGAMRRNAMPHPLMTFSLWGSPSHRGGARLPAPSSHVLSIRGQRTSSTGLGSRHLRVFPNGEPGLLRSLGGSCEPDERPKPPTPLGFATSS